VKTITVRIAPARRGTLRTLILAALATSALSPARAQTSAPVATPPLQPANSRTGLDVTPGGTPIVNIATPDASGTSYNVFTRLSVGKEGLIFANSPTTGNSAIGGFLIANPNLKDGRSASLILNEVTGGVRTTLAGPMEIFGQRAALVIANPTGITCDGCGFINTSRVSLAAATLRFGADGAFSGFRIAEGGDVTVEGKGLLGGNVDYFDIIAAATHINASLYAKDLLIAGGSGTVDYASRSANAEGAGARTGVAIDSSVLGGMYANRIRLVGTGAGLGINLQGTVAALDGTLTITSDGAIALAGAIAAGDTAITARGGGVTLSGQTYAGGALSVTGQAIRQRGDFAGALGAVTFNAGGAVTFDPGSGVYAGLDASGALSGNGALWIDAAGTIELGTATLASGGALRLDGDSVRQAAGGRLAGAAVTLRTRGSQALAGGVSAAGDIALTGGAIDLSGSLMAGGAARLTAARDLTTGGKIGSSGALALTADTVRISGSIGSNADLTLDAASAIVATGTLQAQGALQITAPSLHLSGTAAAGTSLRITGTNLALSGAVSAEGNAAFTGGAIDLTGSLVTGGAARLSATYDLSIGGQAGANGAMALTADTLRVSGSIGSNADLTLDAVSAIVATGTLQAQGALQLTAPSLRLSGTTAAGAALRIAGADVVLSGSATSLQEIDAKVTNLNLATGALLQSAGASRLELARLDNAGLIASGKDLMVAATGAVTNPGQIVAGGALRLSNGAVFSSTGVLQSGDALDMRVGGAATLAGTVYAGGRATLAAASLQSSAALSVQGALTVAAAGDMALASGSTTYAKGSMALSGAGVALSGALQSDATLDIHAAQALALGGRATASGATTIDAAAGAVLSGTLASGGALTLNAATVAIPGQILANYTVSITAATDNLSLAGTIQAAKDVALTAAMRLRIGAEVPVGGGSGGTPPSSVPGSGGSDAGSGGSGSGDTGSGTTTPPASGMPAADLALDLPSLGASTPAAGSLVSRGAVTLTADEIEIAGTVVAKGDLAALAAHVLTVRGTAWSDGALTAQAGALQVGALASLAAAGPVAITVRDDLANLGTIASNGGAALLRVGGALSTAGMLSAKSDLQVQVAGDVLSSGTLSGESLKLDARDVTLTGATIGTGGVAIAGRTLVLGVGSDTQSGGALALTSGGATILGGKLLATGALSIDATGPLAIGAAADIQAGGTARFRSLDALAGAAGSKIAANGALDFTGATLALAGTIAGNGTLDLVAGDAMTLSGTTTALGDITASAGATDIAGSLASAGKLSLAAGATTLGTGSTVQASGAVTLSATSLAANGTLLAGGNLALTGTGDMRLAGTIAAGAVDGQGQVTSVGDLSIRAGGALQLAAASTATGAIGLVGQAVTLDGTLVALRALSVDAATLTTTGDAQANGTVNLVARGDATLGGTVTGLGGIDVTSGGALVENAALASNAGLRLSAAGMLSHGGTGSALSDVSLQGAGLSLGGTIRGNGLVALASIGGDIALLQGSQASAQRVELRSANAVTVAGTLAAAQSLAAESVGAFTVQAQGVLQAGTSAADGQVTAIGAMTLSAGGTFTHAGAIGSTGSLSLTAQQLSSSGTLSAGADMALVAGSGTIGGSVVGLGGVSVRTTAGGLDLTGTVEGRNVDVASTGGDLALGSVSRVTAYGTGSDGLLTLASSGAIGALGVLAANNDVSVAAAGDLHVGADRTGTDAARALSTLGAVTLRVGGALINDGSIAAGRSLSLTAQGLTSTNLSAGEGIVADIAAATTLRGLTSAREVALTAGGDVTLLHGARLETLGDLRLSTGGALGNAGAITAGSALAGAPVGNITLRSAAALTSTGAIVANNGGVTLGGASVALGGALDAGGGVYAAGALTLNTSQVTLLDGGKAITNADFSYTGTRLVLGAGSLLQSNRNLGIALHGGGYRSGGSLVALGDLAVSVAGGGIDTLAGSGIFAGGAGASARGGSLTLTADAIASAGSIVATASAGGAGGDATVGAVTLAIGGLLHADRTLGMTASEVTITGTAEAGAAIAWSIPTLTVASGGNVKSVGDVTLSGASFANAGTIATGGALTIGTSDDLASSGTFSASGAIDLASGASLTLAAGSQTWAGAAQATPAIDGGNVTLRGVTVASLGTLSATGALALTADRVTVGGANMANGSLSLSGFHGAASSLTVTAGATLATYLGDVALGNLALLNLQGTLTASNGSVSLTAGNTSIGPGGRLAAGRDVTITTAGGGALSIEGQLVASNDLKLADGTLSVGAAGLVQAGHDVSFTSANAVAGSGAANINGVGYAVDGMPISARIAGKISAGNDLRMTLPGAVIADGSAQLVATNALSLTAGNFLLGARYVGDGAGNAVQLGVIAGGDLNLTARGGGVMLDGSVQAGRSLTVDGGGEVRSTGAAQFVAGTSLSLTGSALNLAGYTSGQSLVSLHAGGDITLSGATASNGRVTIAAGTATVTGSGSITVRGGAGNTTAVGRDIGGSANLDIQTGGSFTNQGSLWSDGVVFLKSTGGSIVNDARGANGGITAATIVTQTDAGAFANAAGAFKADNAGLFLGGDFNNSGSFAPSGNYWISAANISNSGLLATSGNLTLQAAGSLYNVGTIYAGNRLTLTAGGALTNDYVGDAQGNGSHGLVLAQSDITITAHDVANLSATIQSLGGGVQIALTGGSLVNRVKNLQMTTTSSGMGDVKLLSGGVYDETWTKRYLEYQKSGGCFYSGMVSTCFILEIDSNQIHYLQSKPGGDGDIIMQERYFDYTGGGSNSSVSANSGGSTISAASDVVVNAGGGSITNQNAAILAGRNISLSAGGRVENIADLLASGTTNSILPGAATVIRAGGAVTIQAGSFANIANNLVGTDSYTASQLVQHASPGAPGAGAPGTGSVGNGASASASGAGGVSGGGVSAGGASATGRGGAGGLAGKGQGGIAVSVAGLAGGGDVAAASRTKDGMRVGDLQGQGPSAGATGDLSGLGTGNIQGAQVVGQVRDGAGGAAAIGLGNQTIGGSALGSGGAAGAMRPGASAIVPGLVAGFNGSGAPTLANQAFGSFLGGFLASFNLSGNAPSLFTYNANPASGPLFSSNPALSSEAALYDSKWFFDRVSPDRATTYTRLGDGFFEALLVSREVQAQSGQAQLSQFGSALDQYQGLLKNAEKAQAGLGLQLGIALTAEQVAALTEPMVWYVQSRVEGQDVLVPVVYLAANDAKAIAGGALVAGGNVSITASGGITNSGTLQAKDIVALAAKGGDIVNASGATIAGGSVIADAARDILLAGGSTLRADSGVTLQAGRDLVTTTVSSTSHSASSTYQDSRHWSNSATTSEQITGATIAAGGNLLLQAGGDMTLAAATLSAGGAAALGAGGNLSLGGTSATTTTTQSERTGKYTNASSTATSTAFVGTSVTAAGPVTLAAGAALTITGSTVKTSDAATGDITLYGGQGVAIVSAAETASLDSRAQTGKKSNTTTSATSTTNQLAAIDAAGDLTLLSPGAVTIAGATVTAGGALGVDVGSLTLSGVIDTVDARVDTSAKKSGLLSSTTKRSSTTTHDETAVASTLSGDTGTVTASGAVTITGANLVASNGLTLAAGGPVTIGTLATTDTEQSSSSVKKSGFSLGGGGLFLGVAKTSTTGSTTDVTQAGSVVGTQAGDLAIVSGGALGITGSTVAAGGDVLLKGTSVTIANALDVRDTTQTTKTSSVGVTLGVQSQLLQSVGNLADMAQLATSTGNDRVAAVAGLAGGMAAVNAYQAGEDLASTWKKGAGDLGISVGATFGISKSSSTNTTHDETVVGSAVSGRDVTIVANGTGATGTIDVRGSTVDAKGNLTLAANGAITLAAAEEEDRQSGNAKSSGFTLGVTSQLGLDKGSLDALSPTISVGLSSSNSNYTGTQVTNVESVLTAGGTATLVTPGALGLDGAIVSGGKAVVDAGSLAIASRQDTSTYQSSSHSASVGASFAFGTGQVSVSGNLSNGKQQGDFASVVEQAGIYAGDQGFAIHVGGDTSLIGAVIASTADPSKNSLTTGTLHASDLENRETWQASQTSIGGGIGGIKAGKDGQASQQGATPLPGLPIKGLGTVTATPPMAMGASGDQSGTTWSAIANGTITITSGDTASAALAQTISRDTSGANAGAIVQQFDEAKRQEIAQGFQAAQTLAAETTALFAHQAQKEAEAKARAKPEEDKAIEAGVLKDSNGVPMRDAKGNLIATTPQAQAYIEKARTDAEKAWSLRQEYGAGSIARLVATALNGAAGSDVSGSLSGLVQASAANVLQGLAAQRVKALVDGLGGSDTEREAARAALQAVVGCAGRAAGGSGDCGSAAMGAAAAVVLNNLLKTGATPATGKDGQPLTLADQEARTNLVATIVAAVASGAGLDTQSASASAQLETQNNSICYTDGTCVVLGKPTAEAEKAWGAFFKSAKGEQALTAYGSQAQVRVCAGSSNAPGCAEGQARLDQAVADFKSRMDAAGLDPKQQAALLAKFDSGQVSGAAIENEVAAAAADRQAKIAFLSGGDGDKQAALLGLSNAKLAEIAAFKRDYDSLTDTAKAIVRSDMASAGKADSLGQAVGAVLGALADPETLRDMYLAEVQTRANGSDFKAGVGDAAKPALEFMADLSTLGSAVDPNTGQLNPYYQTPEGQAAYKAAQARMTARAKAVGGAATAAGSAVLKFIADVTPPGAGDPFYVPTPAEMEAYKARSSAAVGSAVNGAKAVLSATAKPVFEFVDNCMLAGNSASRACGNAAANAGANLAVGMATDGLGRVIGSAATDAISAAKAAAEAMAVANAAEQAAINRAAVDALSPGNAQAIAKPVAGGVEQSGAASSGAASLSGSGTATLDTRPALTPDGVNVTSGNGGAQGGTSVPAVETAAPATANGTANAAENEAAAALHNVPVSQLNYQTISSGINSLDVSSAPNTAVFHSGGTRALAEQYATSNGLTTLESTGGGSWLDNLNLFGQSSQVANVNDAQALTLWQKISSNYASQASGNVTAILDMRKLNPDGVFMSSELPILLKNNNVTQITIRTASGSTATIPAGTTIDKATSIIKGLK
jgi:filamentous hemagglutinin